MVVPMDYYPAMNEQSQVLTTVWVSPKLRHVKEEATRLAAAKGGGRGQWLKGVKRYKFPILSKSWRLNVQHGDYS